MQPNLSRVKKGKHDGCSIAYTGENGRMKIPSGLFQSWHRKWVSFKEV